MYSTVRTVSCRGTLHTFIHEYMPVGSSSSSPSHPSVAHQCIACTIALSSSSSQATVHPAGSTSHEAVNASPHTHCNPAIFVVYTLVYCQARTRECIVTVAMPCTAEADESICHGLGLWIHCHHRPCDRQFGRRSTCDQCVSALHRV
jgi:hypothetical protein